MTGGQRTFELIPTSLVKSNGQRRPMTSKAAKKAYQQANRGPKVSRAEQHRRDNAELEQQKREYEKERAAARAKAAREKKAAKANEEREARRKQGLPEPSKFVHASQPTISRFVRSNSTSKRTWQQMESVAEDSDKTISDTEKDDEGPLAKRRPPDESSDNEFGEFPSLSQSDLLEQIDSSILSAKDGKPASGSLAKAHPPLQTCRREASPELPPMKESDADAILTSQALDELVTTQLLSDLVEAVAKSDSIEPPNRHASQSQAETTLAPKPQPSPRRSGRVAEKFEKAATVLNATKPVTVPIAEIPKRVVDTTKPYDVIVNSLRNDGFKTPAPKPILQGRSVNMPSPRLPTRVSRAAVSIHTPQKPSDLSRHARYSASKPFSNIPPSSTQAFLENHLEDFFPSPTQAVRELLDDVDDLPSNTQVARDLSPEKAEKFKFEDFCSTQDLILSPEDLVELITPNCSPLKPLDEAATDSLNRRVHINVDEELNPSNTIKKDLNDFFGTQDLILSPQDWDEICSPSRAPPTPSQKANSEDSSSRAIVPPHPTSQRKGRFFQEKEEDLYHAAIQESKATSTQVTTKVQADISASFGRNQSDSTDYGDFDFNLPGLFKQKEDEDLEAAIHESKITAELEAKRLALVGTLGITRIQSNSTAYGDFDLPRLFEENEEEIHKSKTGSKAQAPQHAEDLTTNNGKGKPRRFFEEKYEDQLHAATHESKMLAAQKVPLKEGSEKPERTLKRVLSTATDYGDDDFTGCSQELLNLC
ncbi:hypothetical protein BKA65DRAFT_595056 [Rhexocercosporidium sp. MPI-PUGE-AT-0058]|nr:hypothetical protein BKA65DRAFT_595056 [Rhexocercosporidium sp. MPI-PUGE-AT-0058]